MPRQQMDLWYDASWKPGYWREAPKARADEAGQSRGRHGS